MSRDLVKNRKKSQGVQCYQTTASSNPDGCLRGPAGTVCEAIETHEDRILESLQDTCNPTPFSKDRRQRPILDLEVECWR